MNDLIKFDGLTFQTRKRFEYGSMQNVGESFIGGLIGTIQVDKFNEESGKYEPENIALFINEEATKYIGYSSTMVLNQLIDSDIGRVIVITRGEEIARKSGKGNYVDYTVQFSDLLILTKEMCESMLKEAATLVATYTKEANAKAEELYNSKKKK